ncbi:MAG: prolipoprotein diacylglyceryl transferase [Lachnospiraceae bacterium]|nr:prolipoprotein diacylglyceryl transferase [Lachnospiraceae bacterium]MDY4069436.1 prolipoprotein diacylglyceryl transferase [Lachnospiraceae bacterium]
MQQIMDAGDIAFPHLNIYLNNVPKTFSVFGFEVAYYGLIIGIAVLLGVLLAVHQAKVTGQDPDLYWDFALYAIVFSIIGARVYYVVFSWDNYKDDLLSIFNTRGGGLAIYGAVIGAFLTAFIYCRVKKVSFLRLCDTGVVGLILGQVIGRWGNFMNREAFGEYTDNLFAMRLPIDAVRQHEITETMWAHVTEGVNYIQVHPTFLYESMWNLVLLCLLLLYWKHKKFEGEIAILYFGGYGLGRCMIEGLRTDQLLLPHTNLAVSQILAGILVVFAIVVEVSVRTKKTQV